MTSHHNQRNYSRSKVPVAATLTPAGGKPFGVTVVDLSMSGVFLRNTPLAMGSKCSLSILLGHINHELPIIAESTVVRTNEDGIALRFESVKLDSTANLQHLIIEHADDPEQATLEFSSRGGWIFTP